MGRTKQKETVMVASTPTLLEQTLALFESKGWSATDLAQFRMELDPENDDDPEDDPQDPPTPTADDIKKMQAALKKANKEAETARLKLQEIEDAGKSETQKVTEERDALKGDLTAAQAAALRYEIALDKGIPKSIATRLQGSTREEMEKDADDLLKELGGVKKPQSFDGGAKDTGHEGGGSFLSKALRDKRSA